jgi:Protein of unknown function (DUF2874).
MKKILIPIAFFIVYNVNAQQKSKVPEAAKTSFSKLFSKAEKVKWGKEGNDFEVDFRMNSKKMSAVFDATGNCKETEEAVDINQIPAKSITYFKEHYKSATIKETAKIVKADQSILYEIGIKGKDILFDAEGNFMKEAKD